MKDDIADEARYRFRRNAINYLTNVLHEDLVRDTQRGHALEQEQQVVIAFEILCIGQFSTSCRRQFRCRQQMHSVSNRQRCISGIERKKKSVHEVAISERDREYKKHRGHCFVNYEFYIRTSECSGN